MMERIMVVKSLTVLIQNVPFKSLSPVWIEDRGEKRGGEREYSFAQIRILVK